MRSAIYARYSSDKQREASIEDQVRVCRRLIDQQDWTLVCTYEDCAISGASHWCPTKCKKVAWLRGHDDTMGVRTSH